jgi:hypothetical protein
VLAILLAMAMVIAACTLGDGAIITATWAPSLAWRLLTPRSSPARKLTYCHEIAVMVVAAALVLLRQCCPTWMSLLGMARSWSAYRLLDGRLLSREAPFWESVTGRAWRVSPHFHRRPAVSHSTWVFGVVLVGPPSS